MNCRGFQKRLEEYLDETLSPWARQAAERHLARCDACREAVQRQEYLASSFSGHLKQSAGSLRLSPQLQARVLRAMTKPERGAGRAVGYDWWFLRPVWASAATLTLLVAAILGARHFGSAPAGSDQATRPSALISTASFQASVRVPAHIFRREGGFVTDALDYKTVTVDSSVFSGSQSTLHN